MNQEASMELALDDLPSWKQLFDENQRLKQRLVEKEDMLSYLAALTLKRTSFDYPKGIVERDATITDLRKELASTRAQRKKDLMQQRERFEERLEAATLENAEIKRAATRVEAQLRTKIQKCEAQLAEYNRHIDELEERDRKFETLDASDRSEPDSADEEMWHQQQRKRRQARKRRRFFD